ncbi:hypothetical protein VNO78_14962 [Psophocarpus tetragonolobus]|uniref:Uncharacterized protein n=1 Tax=Psophocarpus tetragonolobus TaxID=3891 RepID=A0AAN9SD96_PSOTE
MFLCTLVYYGKLVLFDWFSLNIISVKKFYNFERKITYAAMITPGIRVLDHIISWCVCRKHGVRASLAS